MCPVKEVSDPVSFSVPVMSKFSIPLSDVENHLLRGFIAPVKKLDSASERLVEPLHFQPSFIRKFQWFPSVIRLAVLV